MTRNQEIANIILQQLGGNKFIVMTGAKQFVAIDRGIRFRIGRNATRTNMMRITLRGDDTYKMEFIYIRKLPNRYSLMAKYLGRGMDPVQIERKIKQQTDPNKLLTVLKVYDGIYCDQLQELFTEYTKLYTRLF